MSPKRWQVAAMLVAATTVTGIALAEENAAAAGATIDGAALPASISRALQVERHHHRHHHTQLGGIKR